MMQNNSFGPMQSDQATSLFWHAVRKGWFHRLWSLLTRHPVRLLDLDEITCCTQMLNSHYNGIHSVDMNCIRGTQGKAEDFDNHFHPLKTLTRSRWLSIAWEKLRNRDLPPVELIDVNGVCYVRDGHHRISVARSLGQDFIDAEITTMNYGCHDCEQEP